MWQGSEYFRRRRQFRFLQFQIFKRLNSIETQNFIPNFFRIGLKVILSNLLFPTWEWLVNFFSSICWMICREKFCRRKTNPSKTHLAERGAASNDICFSSNDNSGKFAPKRRITIEEHQFCHTQINIEFHRRGKFQNWRKTSGRSESCFKTKLKGWDQLLHSERVSLLEKVVLLKDKRIAHHYCDLSILFILYSDIYRWCSEPGGTNSLSVLIFLSSSSSHLASRWKTTVSGFPTKCGSCIDAKIALEDLTQQIQYNTP